MKKNIIILTSGLSGSSVLTGFLARAGYWMGDSTHKKKDYDTYENRELIDLNLRLFQEAGYKGNYLTEFSPAAMEQIRCLFGKVDDHPYRSLIDKCNGHRPWIWKDPRLWLTVRFWQNLLDLNECKFILLSRGLLQSWVSATLRRQITTYRYSKTYEQGIQQSAIDFCEKNSLPYLHLTYEQLIVHPGDSIERLNGYLDTSLTVEDLKQVYHKPLYRNPRNSWTNHVKAVLIYVKNYSERVDLR